MAKVKPAIQWLKEQANGAEDTKQAIITAYNSDEYISSRVKQIETQAIKEVMDMDINLEKIDLSNIETIVLRNKKEEREERE